MKTALYFLIIISLWLNLSCDRKGQLSLDGRDSVAIAQDYLDLQFEADEIDSLRENLAYFKSQYERLHQNNLSNDISPALVFDPGEPAIDISRGKSIFKAQLTPCDLPENREELAFYDVSELGYLIREKKVSSVELTELFLNRLKKYGDTLQCVITLTDSMAMAQAKRADNELAQGKWRGPLHGIPYGAKDLLAVSGYKTTWGAKPFENQILHETATVVKKLEEAGAVLVAKLTLGALAYGDVWYGGMTKNPWNMEQGSSGSSAGSAAATSAGLVPFAIGTETWGSIVSPSTRCGTSGLRPTFGRVSRHGAMALSWSMDKIGPICRSAKDCALVFDIIKGTDGMDQSLKDYPFYEVNSSNVQQLKIGYFKQLFDESSNANDSVALAKLREAGIQLENVDIPDSLPTEALGIILFAEAAAAFDDLTRSNMDSLLVRQSKNAWPNEFRSARFIPAVEYIQANRWRSLLIDQWNQLFDEYDVIITPSFGGNQLLATNLTGHPCVVVPNGFNEEGSPTSISFISGLYDEGSAIAVAELYQKLTKWDEQHPDFFKL